VTSLWWTFANSFLVVHPTHILVHPSTPVEERCSITRKVWLQIPWWHTSWEYRSPIDRLRDELASYETDRALVSCDRIVTTTKIAAFSDSRDCYCLSGPDWMTATPTYHHCVPCHTPSFQLCKSTGQKRQNWYDLAA